MIQRIAVGTDGSETASKAVDFALDLAEKYGSHVVIVVVAVLAATSVLDNWSEWVVLGGIVFATIGFAVAINRRQYPTAKRGFTRDSKSDW